MCKLNSTLFVQVAAPRGHRRKNPVPRVMLSGATVLPQTKALTDAWTPKAGSLGRLHDQTYAHAKKTGFRPAKHLPSGAARPRVRGSATAEDRAGRSISTH